MPLCQEKSVMLRGIIVNIYGDESGSINNHSENNKHFIICLVKVNDKKKVHRAYKRFVSANYDRLKALDTPKYSAGAIVRDGNKMFDPEGNFIELKGSQFDRELKSKFVDTIIKYGGLEIYYINVRNDKLTDTFAADTSSAYNFPMKLALMYFYQKGYFLDEDLHLQLDIRNERTNKKYFLEQYLNTELHSNNVMNHSINVTYFDSKQNKIVQIADVLANLYYSHLLTEKYGSEISCLRNAGLLKFIFKFPLS